MFLVWGLLRPRCCGRQKAKARLRAYTGLGNSCWVTATAVPMVMADATVINGEVRLATRQIPSTEQNWLHFSRALRKMEVQAN